MKNECDFPNLAAAAARLGQRRDLTAAELRQLLCHDCAFWHEEHEEDLECSCFRILKLLLEDGAITPRGLAYALIPDTDGD